MIHYYRQLIFIICLYGLSLTIQLKFPKATFLLHFNTTHYIQIFYLKFQTFLVKFSCI